MNNIPSHTKYGLLAGGIIIVLKYLLAVSFPGLSLRAWLMEYAGSIIVLSILLYVAATAQRKENNGVTTFKEAMFIGIYVSFITSLLVGCFHYVYARYIDPANSERLVQYTADQLKHAGKTAQQIESAITRARIYYSPGSQFQAGMTWVLFGGIPIAAIIAYSIKKDIRYLKFEKE